MTLWDDKEVLMVMKFLHHSRFQVGENRSGLMEIFPSAGQRGIL